MLLTRRSGLGGKVTLPPAERAAADARVAA